MDETTDTTTFGIMTGLDAFSGGMLTGLQDVSTIAGAAGSTAVSVNTAVARANAPVTATPVVVDTVSGRAYSGGIPALASNPMALVLLIVIIVAVATHG